MGDAGGEGAAAFDATAAAASASAGPGPTGPSRPGGLNPGGPSALHARLAGDEGGYGYRSPYSTYSGGYGGGMSGGYSGGYGRSYGGYGGMGAGYSRYGGGYGMGGFGGYGGGYGGYGGYGGMSGMFGSRGMMDMLGQGGEMMNGVQNSVQGVMHTVARVSGLLEELMRNFTMIFESIFGLFYSVAAFKEEMGASLPQFEKGFVRRMLMRVLRKLYMLFKFVLLFAASPITHRFSPVRGILRILGLLPPALEDEQFSSDFAQEEIQRDTAISVNEYAPEDEEHSRSNDQNYDEVEAPNL
uniref:Peroxin-13 n=1 Tax=Rhodosorus marinus TaxID=101924 RepID=A0A7S0BPW2_9RHOD|mmetsp:Transcript_3886/g.5489  ORF Transcript_3886/g.5489 Transcript_3886/m.5489 type:complete len:299 (+) Transcript_3886:210-1106(+)